MLMPGWSCHNRLSCTEDGFSSNKHGMQLAVDEITHPLPGTGQPRRHSRHSTR